MGVSAYQISEFASFFKGSETGYGQHTYNFQDGAKEKGDNRTVKDKLVTQELYQAHLDGKLGLGVVPVNKEGECRFTVIDIDIYDTSLDIFIQAIERNNFPLVPFKSKSGGLHIYMFLKEWTQAKDAIEATRKMASVLMMDVFVKKQRNVLIEIFPKQARVQAGSVGNWINLPYYNAENTRQAAIIEGHSATLEEALLYIKSKVKTIEEVLSFINQLPYSDAPPCLQTIWLLNAVGENEGRNNYLFSFGAYLKKKNEAFFEQYLYEVNNSMKAPVTNNELELTVINSLRKKDYNYRCKEFPCVEYCNKTECKMREFGVGKTDGYFSNLEYGQLTQYKQDVPYYEWLVRAQGDTEWKCLRFKNEMEIIHQDTFQQLCFRELYVLPPKLKVESWAKLVRDALVDIKIIAIEMTFDTSPISILKSLICDFITGRAPAVTLEGVNQKRVFFDDKASRYLFKPRDLTDFVFITKQFKHYQPAEMHSKMRDFGCYDVRVRIGTGDKAKQYRLYAIDQIAYAKNLQENEDMVDIEGAVKELEAADAAGLKENAY